MDFGELCNEFECISSPLVESTARQLVRDILELREGNRALGTFAVSVTYKVFFLSFVSRTTVLLELDGVLTVTLACPINLKLFLTSRITKKEYYDQIISISAFSLMHNIYNNLNYCNFYKFYCL